MKKEDIKSAQPLGLAEGMVIVEAAKLRKTGLGSGIKFHVGDKITVPDMEDLQVYSTTFTARDGKEREYELIKVGFNDRVKLIPVASFRRDKNGVDEVADEYSRKSALCRDLQMANDDYERISILAGHTVIVKEVFGTGRNYKYVNGERVPYNKDDTSTFTTAAWPVFEMVD
jgi:hypothetical protein